MEKREYSDPEYELSEIPESVLLRRAMCNEDVGLSHRNYDILRLTLLFSFSVVQVHKINGIFHNLLHLRFYEVLLIDY